MTPEASVGRVFGGHRREREYSAWGFGDSPTMATELGLLVRDGPKRATAGLVAEYAEGEPLPAVGDYSVILDGDGAAVCVIRTTAVEIRRFDEVDADFAWTEGEGDRTLADWREGHIRFFERCGHAADGRHARWCSSASTWCGRAARLGLCSR